jgi:hypothetical protein
VFPKNWGETLIVEDEGRKAFFSQGSEECLGNQGWHFQIQA